MEIENNTEKKVETRGRKKMENRRTNTQYVHDFINKNKDKLSQKFICQYCNSKYTYFNKCRHLQTSKCLKYKAFSEMIFDDEKDKQIYALKNGLKYDKL